MRLVSTLAAAAVAGSTLAAQGGWTPSPEVVAKASAGQAGFNYEESRVPAYSLPDVMGEGEDRVESRDHWATRRAAILELFREHVYGRRPGKPESL